VKKIQQTKPYIDDTGNVWYSKPGNWLIHEHISVAAMEFECREFIRLFVLLQDVPKSNNVKFFIPFSISLEPVSRLDYG
jgi:hypothetical protein